MNKIIRNTSKRNDDYIIEEQQVFFQKIDMKERSFMYRTANVRDKLCSKAASKIGWIWTNDIKD